MFSLIIEKIPNILTVLRILLVPLICIFMNINTFSAKIVSIILLCGACISDFFDGKLARKWKVVSAFGRCLDPIADKVLVMAVLVMLVSAQKAWLIPSIAILFREFLISGIREFVAKEKQITIYVSKLAKFKTATQMISLILLVIADNNSIILLIGNIFLSISALLSAITSVQYIFGVRNIFKD